MNKREKRIVNEIKNIVVSEIKAIEKEKGNKLKYFQVREMGGDWQTIKAKNRKGAALKWAKRNL